ncbi:MAG TPA: nucleotidyltransferase domain-containing protein [Candidatus Nanoarchaeia archaeon]|nr:nucleotidyltransferase domain-containing protein [Candidatus Nanoarchaeia archaeon]
MEIVAKISKGSKMDQVYLPKKRNGFYTGSYVILKPLEAEKPEEKPYFYNITSIEPIKLRLVLEIMQIIEKELQSYENIIITGSFLEPGFHFNDIDVLVISNNGMHESSLKKSLEEKTRVKIHLIMLSQAVLMQGLSTDPLYQMMMSKAIAKKRMIYHTQRKPDYKLLDLHLLKSRPLIANFDALNGEEKYGLTRNMLAISLFLQDKKVSKASIDNEIKQVFHIKDVMEIKQNTLNKKKFLGQYKRVYSSIFNHVMDGVNHGSKQK